MVVTGTVASTSAMIAVMTPVINPVAMLFPSVNTPLAVIISIIKTVHLATFILDFTNEL